MTTPLFTLDPTIRRLYQDGIDTLIDQLGRDCQLFLDGPQLPCPNCFFDSAGMRSSGTYNGTGPARFYHPPCPVCMGSGYDPTAREAVEVRHFSIKRNIKPSTVLPPGTLNKPASIARIKGLATDLPVVLQAKYVILDYKNAVYMNEKYARFNEPSLTGSIVAGRYFVCFLQKV